MNTKNVQYLEIFKQAFQIVWKNKFLWFFGFLIFLGSSGLMNQSLKLKSNNQSLNWDDVIYFIKDSQAYTLDIDWRLFALGILLVLLKIVGTAGIIKSVNNLFVYRQSSIRAILAEIKKYFLRLVLMEIVILMAFLIVMLILLIPITYLLTTKAYFFSMIILLVAAFIFIPLAALIYYLRRYAYFYITLADVKIKTALEMAYDLLKKNIKESLMIGLFSIIGVALCSLITFVLTMLVGSVSLFLNQDNNLLVIFIQGAVINSIVFLWYFSFMQTVWVLFFQQISLEKQKEKNMSAEVASTEELPVSDAV
jgi:hypothetical protein